MYTPHDQGNLYWYLENFGCEFTKMILYYFTVSKHSLFNENMMQESALVIKKKSFDKKLNQLYKAMLDSNTEKENLSIESLSRRPWNI